MDKDKGYNDINDSIKKALDIMESPSELNEKETSGALEDDECLQTCRDIMDMNVALQQQQTPGSIDVEAELVRFKAKHTKRKPFAGLKLAISLVSAAAILTGLVFIISNTLDIFPTPDPITVFTADNTPQEITLQAEDGEKMILGESQKDPKVAAKTKEYLDYSRTKKTVANVPNAQNTIQTHTLTIPRGQNFRVILCDGTEVWLNANTRLIYPTAFVEKERTVYLEGEAYFKVTPNKQQPFIVKTPSIQTRVLGTEFNIRSYNPEDSHVVLINGKVEVSNTQGGAYTAITPGEDAHLQADGNFILTEVDLDSYIYWKDGYFYFDDVTLREIMQNLGRWYNVSIEFRNKEAMNYKMHFVADRRLGLEHTIQLLNRMKKVTVTLNGNTLTID